MTNSNDTELHGANLEGSDQKDSVDHADFKKARKPDAELHLDDEKDTLYSDGLDVEEDSETLSGTRGAANRG